MDRKSADTRRSPFFCLQNTEVAAKAPEKAFYRAPSPARSRSSRVHHTVENSFSQNSGSVIDRQCLVSNENTVACL